MTMKRRAFIFRLTASLALLPLLSGIAPAQSTAMPEAVKNMMRFTGSWEDSATRATMGDQHFTTPYFVHFTAINDGTGLMMEEGANIPGMGKLMGTNLMGWDPNLRQMHLYSVDNMGTCHDHVGYWTGPNELYFQYQGVMEGKMFVEQIWITINDAETMGFTLTGELNGAPYQRIDATFKRRSS